MSKEYQFDLEDQLIGHIDVRSSLFNIRYSLDCKEKVYGY